MNPQRAGLLADLASTPWHLMRVLADEAEDAGEPWLAAGWRWLAQYRKWPARMVAWPDQYVWMVEAQRSMTILSAHLPEECRAHLPGKVDASLDSLQERLLAGATAVGLWLKDEAARAEHQKELAQIAAAIKDCKTCGGTGVVTYQGGRMAEACEVCRPLRQRRAAVTPPVATPQPEVNFSWQLPTVIPPGASVRFEPPITLKAGEEINVSFDGPLLRGEPLQRGDPVTYDEGQQRWRRALPGEAFMGRVAAGAVVRLTNTSEGPPD
jgi:hypothetical protein